MKRCPECGREYDNPMMFCLDDGAQLLYGPASREARIADADEPATMIWSRPIAKAGDVRQEINHGYESKTAILNSVESQTGNFKSIAVLLFVHTSADPENVRHVLTRFCPGKIRSGRRGQTILAEYVEHSKR